MPSRRQILQQILLSVIGGLWASSAGSQENDFNILYERARSGALKRGPIKIHIPHIVEDGTAVAIRLIVDSPMTKDDYIKAVHLFAEGNPNPLALSYYFSPACGRADASTRIRLARSQRLLCIAQTSRDVVFMNAADVEVTIGGCNG